MKIGKVTIGGGTPVYFIADIASNHDGSLARAKKLIELAKRSGASAAKFQNFHADKIVSDYGFRALKGSGEHQAKWKKSVYETYDECTVPDQWTRELKQHCDKVGIEYMSSPYDEAAVEQINPSVNCYKIGSGDIDNLQLLEYIAAKKKPILLATGASTLDDIKQAVRIIKKSKQPYAILQCNTNYTNDDHNIDFLNLAVLKQFANLFPDAVLGLSDHTKSVEVVVGAVALGAAIIERHFTDDNARDGPDHKFALNATDFKKMVESVQLFKRALGDGNKKVEKNEKASRILQRRAIRLSHDMKKGTILMKNDLVFLRPCPEDGFSPAFADKIIGSKLMKNKKSGDIVGKGDISR